MVKTQYALVVRRRLIRASLTALALAGIVLVNRSIWASPASATSSMKCRFLSTSEAKALLGRHQSINSTVTTDTCEFNVLGAPTATGVGQSESILVHVSNDPTYLSQIQSQLSSKSPVPTLPKSLGPLVRRFVTFDGTRIVYFLEGKQNKVGMAPQGYAYPAAGIYAVRHGYAIDIGAEGVKRPLGITKTVFTAVLKRL